MSLLKLLWILVIRAAMGRIREKTALLFESDLSKGKSATKFKPRLRFREELSSPFP